MMIRCSNGAVIILDQCHWTEGAYLSLTHAGGAGTVLDVATIDQVAEELARIKQAILEHQVNKPRSAA